MSEQINYVGYIQQLIRDEIIHMNTHTAEININLKSKYNISLDNKELQKWLNRIVRKKLYGYKDIKHMKGFHYNPNPNKRK